MQAIAPIHAVRPPAPLIAPSTTNIITCALTGQDSRAGRYHEIRHNMRVNEVAIDDGAARDRFVICHNPEQAERDATIRGQLVDRLQTAIDGTDSTTHDERVALAAGLPGALHRYLRTTKTGLLRVDKTAIRAEAKLDGKCLLRTADPSLSAEDIALGYKQLLEVERGWRDMKSTLEGVRISRRGLAVA